MGDGGEGLIDHMTCGVGERDYRREAVKKLGGRCHCCGMDTWWNLIVDARGTRIHGRTLHRWVADGRHACEDHYPHIDLTSLRLICYGCNANRGDGECTIDHGSVGV